jgi:hypothetical protein
VTVKVSNFEIEIVFRNSASSDSEVASPLKASKCDFFYIAKRLDLERL